MINIYLWLMNSAKVRVDKWLHAVRICKTRSIASKMCEHSQREALARDFRSMQFNFVISTNEAAIRLWKKQGFEVVGTLPEAFRHPRKGFVDAYVMFKKLVP